MTSKDLYNNGVFAPKTNADSVLMGKHGESLSSVLRQSIQRNLSNVNKYFTIIIDDMNADSIGSVDWFESMGIKPCFGLRTDLIDGQNFTWEDVKTMYDSGYNIAYHGTKHNMSDDELKADIPAWLALAKKHGIETIGYVGPNGSALPLECEKYFMWARWATRGNSNSYFASVSGIWLDEITDTTKETIATSVSNLTDDCFIVLCWHSPQSVTNRADLEDIINSLYDAGLIYLTPEQAVEQSCVCAGSIGHNTNFEISAGVAENPYWICARNGKVRTNQQSTF